MEHTFKKHASHYRLSDCSKQSPAKGDTAKPHTRKSTPKHKTDKLYTQFSSSSRMNNKISASTHHSPSKPKPEKLLKTSVLNYLHKCRSEYEETSTMLTHHNPSKTAKSMNMPEQEASSKCFCDSKPVQSELLARTSSLLNSYKSKCLDL